MGENWLVARWHDKRAKNITTFSNSLYVALNKAGKGEDRLSPGADGSCCCYFTFFFLHIMQLCMPIFIHTTKSVLNANTCRQD